LIDCIHDGNNGKQGEEKILAASRDYCTQATYATSEVLHGIKQVVECTNSNSRRDDGHNEERLKKLREKLEEERRLLAFSSLSSSQSDHLDREAKLRVQARLRIRLAAAKRELDTRDEHTLAHAREEALAVSLRSRRTC
jgi:nucleoid-associated protein YejK